MPLKIYKSKIIYSTKTKIWNSIGVFILFSVMLFYIVFCFSNAEKQFKNFTTGSINFIIILFLVVLAIRAIYFFRIDKDYIIERHLDKFIVNQDEYLVQNLSKIHISCYGNNIREYSCNVYLKLNNTKKIPVAINLQESELDELIIAIKLLLSVKEVEKRKYLFNF